ncbi:hypothetical protein ACNOYE_04820 [Nannocystaceae bacterium ST9]
MAKLLGIEGRSALSKARLALALAEREHGEHLEHRDLVVVATQLEIAEPQALALAELVERVRARA